MSSRVRPKKINELQHKRQMFMCTGLSRGYNITRTIIRIRWIFIHDSLKLIIVNKQICEHFVYNRRFVCAKELSGLEVKAVCLVFCFPLVPNSDMVTVKYVYYRYKLRFLLGIINIASYHASHFTSIVIWETPE